MLNASSLSLPAAQRRIYDFHNNVRLVLYFRDRALLDSYFMRTMENHSLHCFLGHSRDFLRYD